MISIPEIRNTSEQDAAVIHLTIARSDMQKQFGPAVGELMSVLATQGVKPSGAIFAHHLTMTSDMFDFELGMPVTAPVRAHGRVQPGRLPAATVAHTIYSGPYEGLPSAWAEFMTWMTSNGHTPADDLWEVYSVGPQSSPDPADWRTDLYRPLRP